VHCEGTFGLDGPGPLSTLDGEEIVQGMRTGAFAERVVVDQSQAVVIPAAITLEAAALLACGVITCYGAVVNTARVTPGSSVVVVGTGGVGLNAVQAAALAGASAVVAVDLSDTKLEAARRFGATHTANPDRDDVGGIVARLTDGRCGLRARHRRRDGGRRARPALLRRGARW
jgi:S-(hydroxymethyl)glutathione dehydrogenase/alcohol dehydrogenase